MGILSSVFRFSPTPVLTSESRLKAAKCAKKLASILRQARNNGNAVSSPAVKALSAAEREVAKLVSRSGKKNFSCKTALRNVGKLHDHTSDLQKHMHGIFKGGVPDGLKHVRALMDTLRSDENCKALPKDKLNVYGQMR
ncbi:hypothetical protein J1G36_27580 [Pseudomonas carnis]|uniref:hypothetical protein n=1 Tax=Pseudomonas TaxID=286 RepID=UPI000F560B9E|nr:MULTISPECIES: hypothetical protein [Pseudomonas]MBY8955642.1 hypothetical protein [Pseudomonas carnis]